MTAITAKPLDIHTIFSMTGKDACAEMGKYKVRIMNYSAGQEIPCTNIIGWKNYKWGIRPVKTDNSRYDYFAFLVA